jgi:hypothetical protein
MNFIQITYKPFYCRWVEMLLKKKKKKKISRREILFSCCCFSLSILFWMCWVFIKLFRSIAPKFGNSVWKKREGGREGLVVVVLD